MRSDYFLHVVFKGSFDKTVDAGMFKGVAHLLVQGDKGMRHHELFSAIVFNDV